MNCDRCNRECIGETMHPHQEINYDGSPLNQFICQSCWNELNGIGPESGPLYEEPPVEPLIFNLDDGQRISVVVLPAYDTVAYQINDGAWQIGKQKEVEQMIEKGLK